MRTSNLQLPDAEELMEILTKESSRQAVHYDYLDVHPEIFGPYKVLLERAGIEGKWLSAYKQTPLSQLMIWIDEAHHKLTKYITQNVDEKLYTDVFATLAIETELIKSDGIFVFGSPVNARVERAIELYEQGIAPKIIISGRGPHYGVNHESEAERMAQVALTAGVPGSALVLEEAAITIPDNVKRTLDLFENINWKPQSLTIVASSFVLRRAVIDWYKFAPWDIAIHATAPRTSRITKDNWFLSHEGRSVVLNEYVKMIFEAKIDLIRKGE